MAVLSTYPTSIVFGTLISYSLKAPAFLGPSIFALVDRIFLNLMKETETTSRSKSFKKFNKGISEVIAVATLIGAYDLSSNMFFPKTVRVVDYVTKLLIGIPLYKGIQKGVERLCPSKIFQIFNKSILLRSAGELIAAGTITKIINDRLESDLSSQYFTMTLGVGIFGVILIQDLAILTTSVYNQYFSVNRASDKLS